jgi:hypothetical protein
VTEAFGIVGLIFCGAAGVWHMMGQDRGKDPRPNDCKCGEMLVDYIYLFYFLFSEHQPSQIVKWDSTDPQQGTAQYSIAQRGVGKADLGNCWDAKMGSPKKDGSKQAIYL